MNVGQKFKQIENWILQPTLHFSLDRCCLYFFLYGDRASASFIDFIEFCGALNEMFAL